ncbi:MAG: hypothetical protein AAGD00_00145 [Planctomycetota bacterium]
MRPLRRPIRTSDGVRLLIGVSAIAAVAAYLTTAALMAEPDPESLRSAKQSAELSDAIVSIQAESDG